MSDVVPTTAVVVRAGDVNLGERELAIVREQLAPDATKDELTWFGHVANHLGLDPFRGQIVLIGRYDRRVKRNVHRPQVTVDGRLALAEATGELDGIEGPMWCGPRTEHDGQLVWQEVWMDDERPPYCARTLVYRKGRRQPTANGTAKWSEFVQMVGDFDGAGNRVGDKLAPLWRQMPSHMLGKVSLSMALRRAFSDVIRGIAVESEYEVLDVEAAPDAAVRDVTETTTPATDLGPDNEVRVPTTEQTRELRAALVATGRTTPKAQLAYIADVLGRDTAAWKELNTDDYRRVHTALGAGAEAADTEWRQEAKVRLDPNFAD